MTTIRKQSLHIHLLLCERICSTLNSLCMFPPLINDPYFLHFSVHSSYHLIDFLQTAHEVASLVLVLAYFFKKVLVTIKALLRCHSFIFLVFYEMRSKGVVSLSQLSSSLRVNPIR